MTNKYTRPEAISSDMGGAGGKLDQRMQDVLMLLESAPLEQIASVLDIGIGQGQLAKWFAQKGKQVTGVGLELRSYDLDVDLLKSEHNITIMEANANVLPFKTHSFDAVVMSHILEHVGNISLVLSEIRRVLKPTGYLLLFVPPHEDYVVAGHISVGWNVGQLLYVLAVNGFDVRHGNFIEYGYNVCAFVQKSEVDLPTLRGDRGDIYILNKAGILPLPIFSNHDSPDQYWGRIKSINWPNKVILDGQDLSPQMKIIRTIAKLLPFKRILGKIFSHLGRFLTEEGNREFRANPKFLKGR